METIKKQITNILLVLILSSTLYGCVAILAVSENITKLEQEDKKIMAQLEGNLTAPIETPILTDSIAYYKTEVKYITVAGGSLFNSSQQRTAVTMHRFFFKRANYTDSLFSGFSIIVADLGNKGIIVENQDNVTLSATNIGSKSKNWKVELNELTTNKEMYNDFSDNGLKTKTFIRSNKF